MIKKKGNNDSLHNDTQGNNDREKPPVSVLLAGVFGKKSG